MYTWYARSLLEIEKPRQCCRSWRGRRARLQIKREHAAGQLLFLSRRKVGNLGKSRSLYVISTVSTPPFASRMSRMLSCLAIIGECNSRPSPVSFRREFSFLPEIFYVPLRFSFLPFSTICTLPLPLPLPHEFSSPGLPSLSFTVLACQLLSQMVAIGID